jgi:purine-binding chemotaxis protein CheW
MTVDAYTPSTLDEPTVECATAERFLGFVIEGQEYAVNILRVCEISFWLKDRHTVSLPESVIGFLEADGEEVPIVDLRKPLRGDAPMAERGSTCMVVVVKVGNQGGVEASARTVGIAVDAITSTYRIRPEGLQPTVIDELNTTSWLRGHARVQDRSVLLLDLETLLSQTDTSRLTGHVAAAE